MTKRHQMLCAQARNPEPGKAWMYVVVLVALGCVAAPASAQNCTAGNPQLAVAVLQTVLASCSSHDDFQAMESKYGYDVILVQASVAGNLAVPVLRQFASLPKNNECTSSNFGATARTALAKFGDETAYATVKKQWAQHRAGPYPARIDFIGDDWALQTLVEFLIQHANDPRMVVQHGPADGTEDYRSRILAQNRGIARRPAIPALPDAD